MAKSLNRIAAALFEFEQTAEGIAITAEKHYKLVAPESLSLEEIQHYIRHDHFLEGIHDQDVP